MIRDTAKKNDRKGRWTFYVWIALFALITVCSTSALAWQGKSWGMPAFILLMGVAIVSVLAILTLTIHLTSSHHSSLKSAEISPAMLAHFMNSPFPSAIIINERVDSANTAYMNLARELGVLIIDGEAPSLGALFGGVDKDAAAAIYRLHHGPQDSVESGEIIHMLTDKGLKAFNIKVTTFKAEQIWRIEDISSQKQQGAPQLSEAPIGLFSVEPDGRIIDMNDVILDWLGFNRDALPENISAFIENPEALLEGANVSGNIIRCDTRLITSKGVLSPTMMCGQWNEASNDKYYASVAVYGHSNFTARQENAKDSNDASYGDTINLNIFEDAPFGVFRLDSNDISKAKIIWGNTVFFDMVKHDIAVNTHETSLFSSLFDGNDVTQSFLDTGVTIDNRPIDLQLAGVENRQVNVYFSNSGDHGQMAYLIDISKRKELEDRLMQSQKMQAIGQLAGGVAHDFNNLLTVIRLNTDELLGRHPIGDPSYPELQQINQTVARSADLVGKLLAFSRKQTMRLEALDVSSILSDLTVMLKRVLVERIQLDVIHGRNLPPILADKSQFDTIFMNLCVNARDAMIEVGKSGTITLKSYCATPDDFSNDDITTTENGGFVIVEVKDTGTGMSAETQKKIFEPFFTTKEQGKGTGLGLATVYGIVEQSGGYLRVDSQLGTGTTFRVYLPIANEKTTEQIKPKPKPIHVKPANLAGQGRILFVEDEDAVRAIAAKTLRKRGYTVIEACDGEEAYEILEGGTDDFDLMISDVVMPGMDGPTLLKKGRKLLGGAQIVFISGYAKEEFSDLLAEEPDVTFLPKPFTLAQLAEKVKSAIGDAS